MRKSIKMIGAVVCASLLPHLLVAHFSATVAHAWDTMDPVPVGRAACVNITDGRLRGFETSVDGREAVIFKRVPYAEPPLGQLRFAPLRPLRRRWTGSWDATRYGPPCWSNTTRTSSPQFNCSEDCIHANVFTSRRCLRRPDGKSSRCPVLFYIHGGNFLYDSAVMFADRQIVEKYASDEVVFVVAGYRLGALGFFDLGDGTDAVVPRNLGLLDIMFALKWTKREVRHFGGDPRHITIMGNSGGGSAVQYLMASDAVPQNLFHAGIVSSGAPLLGHNVNVVQSRLLLRQFGCLGDEGVDLAAGSLAVRLDVLRRQVDCLRRVSAAELLARQSANELEYGVVFQGVGTSPLVPADSFPELLTQFKPRPLLITTTSCEMTRGVQQVDDATCAHNERYFNYRTMAARRLCMHRYNHTRDDDSAAFASGRSSGAKERLSRCETGGAPPLTAEVLHAAAHLTALANTWHGGRSFVGSFRLADHFHHADDLLFFVGLHWTRNRTWTLAERLMDAYYPRMIKNFLRNAEPGDGWEPINQNGDGFFLLDYAAKEDEEEKKEEEEQERVGAASQIVRWPHFVADRNADTDGIRFWLHDEAVAERAEEWWTAKKREVVAEWKRRKNNRQAKRTPVFLQMNVDRVDPIVIDGGPLDNESGLFKAEEEEEEQKSTSNTGHLLTVLAFVGGVLLIVLVIWRIVVCGRRPKAEANERTGMLRNRRSRSDEIPVEAELLGNCII